MLEAHGKRAVENDYVGILEIAGAYGARVVAYSNRRATKQHSHISFHTPYPITSAHPAFNY